MMDDATLNDLMIFVNALKDQLDNYQEGYKLHFDADACKRRATRIYELASGQQSITARLAAADEVAAVAEKAIADLMLEYVSICDPKAASELPESVTEFRAALRAHEATEGAE